MSGETIKSFLLKVANQLHRHPKVSFSWMNFLLLLLAYWRFFNPHYSADTYVVYWGDESGISFLNGRPLGYVTCKLNYLFNLNQIETQWLVTLFFLLVIAICSAHLACRYCTFLTNNATSEKDDVTRRGVHVNESKLYINTCDSLITPIFINLAIVIVFINGFFLDWMRFPECYTQLYAPSIILITLAFIFATNKKPTEKPYIRWIKVATMLLLASWFYQTVLFIFFQLYLGALLINSVKNLHDSIKDALVCLFVLVVVGVLSIVIAKLVFKASIQYALISPFETMRESVNSLGGIRDNVLCVVSNFKQLMLDGFGNAPKYLLCVSFFVAGIMLVVTLVKEYNKKWYLILGFLCIFAIFSLSFLSQLISKTVDFSPRTLVGVYVTLSIFVLSCLCLRGTKCIIGGGCAAIIVVVLIANIGICNSGTKAEILLNSQEHAYCDLVQHEIDKYETESGYQIDRIVRASDSNPSKNMEEIGCEPFNYRNWNVPTPWSTVFMINVLENKNYTSEQMNNEDKERLFGDVSYDSFDAGKQMIFDENTLYLLVF